MSIFAVICQPNPNSQKLGQAIASEFADLNLPLDGGQAWLVASDRTAKDVSDRLGVSDGSNGAAVVIEIGGYFGRADPNVWSWIQSNWEARPARALSGG